MGWKEIQAKLISKNDKQLCMQLSVTCSEAAINFTDSDIVHEALSLLKENEWDHTKYSHLFNKLSKERISNTENLQKRESAHALIHATELATVKSLQSMAAHAARCAEALSRIDISLCKTIMTQYKLI